MLSLVLVAIAAAPVQAKKHAEEPFNAEQVYRTCMADAETVLGLKVADSDHYLKDQGWKQAPPGSWNKAGHQLHLIARHGHISQVKIVK